MYMLSITGKWRAGFCPESYAGYLSITRARKSHFCNETIVVLHSLTGTIWNEQQALILNHTFITDTGGTDKGDSMNQLEQLREMTTVVADTGDIESIRVFRPTDATTNPSLLLKAAQLPQYQHLVESAIEYGKSKANSASEQTHATMRKLAVNFGTEILKIVPGRVSTEVDARMSFRRDGTIQAAEELIALYQENGVSPDHILIKVASTWEGIQAATELEKRGIHCNLTLLFHFAQAAACADAGVTLISPFVGRIFDWYKKAEGVDHYPPADDPGVKSVTSIYNYFKRHGYQTQVMGASFRNTDEILELAGCDLLTIAPNLMDKLQHEESTIARKLDPEIAKQQGMDKVSYDENDFRWSLNEDPMATEKLAAGIRGFAADTLKLEKFVHDMCKDCG